MKRKATKNTRGPNSHEKDFQAWLKEQPCCLSGQNDVQVHHCAGSILYSLAALKLLTGVVEDTKPNLVSIISI